MADDDQPHHRSSSSSGGSATSSDGSSSSPPSPSIPPPPAPPLPLAAVVTPLPAPFPPSSIATAIPLPHQQHQHLLQQYQHQFHHHQQQQQHQQQHQQRLFSFHLSSAAVAPSPPPTAPPLKHPLPPLTSASPAPGFGSCGVSASPSDRHSRDDCWSEGATLTLIHAWGDRYLELNRGNLKQKHWKDVADCVNRRADGSKPHKTDIQCKNRLDTLKKKYKLEKSKIVTGGGPSKWTFFDCLDELIGPSKKPKKPLPVKLRPSLPLLPAPVLALPLKRPLEEVDQPPQLQPPPPPAPNHSASPATNHATTNHAGSVHNHAGSALNNVGSAPNHLLSAPNHVGSTPNHGGSAPNHVGSTPNHVASGVDAVSKSKESPHTADSCPNGETAQPKRVKRKRPHIDPLQELAQAIIKFGEVYERTEITRQQTLTELEKQRMIFTKDLELQRLQFFAQTQVELAKLRNSCKHGNTDHRV